jgi:hypothetical protein
MMWSQQTQFIPVLRIRIRSDPDREIFWERILGYKIDIVNLFSVEKYCEYV